MAECTHRGDEARKHSCLLVGPPRSIRKTTSPREHCSVAVAAKSRSRFAPQGDWPPVENGPNFVKHHCYNWSSGRTNILPRFERLPALGRNDWPSENRESDLGQDRSAECPRRRAGHYR